MYSMFLLAVHLLFFIFITKYALHPMTSMAINIAVEFDIKILIVQLCEMLRILLLMRLRNVDGQYNLDELDGNQVLHG